jgi:hypothetical protein
MPGLAPAAPRPLDMCEMLVIHRALRRDLARFAEESPSAT